MFVPLITGNGSFRSTFYVPHLMLLLNGKSYRYGRWNIKDLPSRFSILLSFNVAALCTPKFLLFTISHLNECWDIHWPHLRQSSVKHLEFSTNICTTNYIRESSICWQMQLYYQNSINAFLMNLKLSHTYFLISYIKVNSVHVVWATSASPISLYSSLPP